MPKLVSPIRKPSSATKKAKPKEVPPPAIYDKSFITHTFSECVENHAGMKMHGVKLPRGFTEDYLNACMIKHGGQILDMRIEDKRAVVWKIPNGVDRLLGPGAADKLHAESWSQQFDHQFLNDKKQEVQYKWGRYNNCYADESGEPDYANGKGRLIAFGDAPMMAALRAKLPELLGDEAKDLYAESNLYPNVESAKVGIGFHGDTERSIVVGVRIGKAQLPLRFQWYKNSDAISDEHVLELAHGDMYVMSWEATGQNWLKTKTVPVLRHGVGRKAVPCPIGGKQEKKKNKSRN